MIWRHNLVDVLRIFHVTHNVNVIEKIPKTREAPNLDRGMIK